MGVGVATMTVLDVEIAIELVVPNAILGITVVLEVITISLVVIVASKDGTIEFFCIITIIIIVIYFLRVISKLNKTDN